MDRATHELIRSYLAKARDKVRVAGALRDRSEWDDAVSRAYYAAFRAAQAALLTEGQRADTHRGTVVLLKARPATTTRSSTSTRRPRVGRCGRRRTP